MFRSFRASPETNRISTRSEYDSGHISPSIVSIENRGHSQQPERTSAPTTSFSRPRLNPNPVRTSSLGFVKKSHLTNSIGEEELLDVQSPVSEPSPLQYKHLSAFAPLPLRTKSETWLSLNRPPPSPVIEDSNEEIGLKSVEFGISNSTNLSERSSRLSIDRVAHKRINSKRLSSGLIYYQPPRQNRPVSASAESHSVLSSQREPIGLVL